MKKLLVIDGDTRTRTRLRSLLRCRHEVYSVRNAFAAFSFLREMSFHVIIVRSTADDPVVIAVLKWLRLHGVRTHVVALFGEGASDSAVIARRLGASAIFDWPTSRARMLDAVASFEDAAPAAGIAERAITAPQSEACTSDSP